MTQYLAKSRYRHKSSRLRYRCAVARDAYSPDRLVAMIPGVGKVWQHAIETRAEFHDRVRYVVLRGFSRT